MGRSKFPGKPTKHVNRKRVNVLCSPFGTTVGDINAVVTVETDDSKKSEAATCNEGLRKVSSDSDKKKKRPNLVSKRASLKRTGMLSSGINHNQVTRRTRSAVTGRRAIRSFRKVSKPKHALNSTKEPNNIVGKFVLPSRSVHSSRVIKPNKRFIHVEASESRTFKKCVVTKRLSEDASDDAKDGGHEPKENSPVRVLHSNGKVVLRQARLQLHTQTATGPEGPFSCNNVSPPGTVTCGVCGAVRFYRFVKQARKFNIYSCESCRKFISKMIKRQGNVTSNVQILACQKGQGMCHVPPIVRSQHWKLFRCAYRARCPACWLKMCLRSFQMPISLKNSLAQLLPKNMQTYDLVFSSPLPLLSWQANVERKCDPKTDEPAVRRRPVRFKADKPVSAPHVPEIKRQKVDLKGPRVKHVCRSASIVLGQPLATFPVDLNKKIDSSEGSEKAIEIKDDISKFEASSKKERISKNISFPENTSMLHVKKKVRDHGKMISIDFWENYNIDEVHRNGFGLVSSAPFSVKAICFLCGSAGREALLHCLICCEPYHPYCLEQIPYNVTKYNEKYNWLCPRCTTCSACGEAYRQKIYCQKCHKAYHPQCFNATWKREDKPTVCSNCLRCRNCDATNITKFIGNLALCLECFKLRNKENLCPVCQKYHGDNDCDVKMMECRKCKKWVHAKCESLTDEQYQILSLLPYSVEYLCQLCSDTMVPYWLEIVHNELRANILTVLRLLAKNCIARNILKLSPYRDLINSRSQVSVKKLHFKDDEVNAVEVCNVDCRGISRQSSVESQDGNVESKLPVLPKMVDIRKKLNSNEYLSLHEFNTCMEQAAADSEELLKIYRTILKKIFPWYDSTRWKQNDDKANNLPGKDVLNKYSSLDCIVVSDRSDETDTRSCSLCKGIGDGLAHRESRLLYCGQNEWVHVNCAFWSSEVYEEIDGSLQNVHAVLIRSKTVRCTLCKEKGASLVCRFKGCHETYHFTCAQNTDSFFFRDQTICCRTHTLDDDLNLLTSPSDFYVLRSVYVEADKKKMKHSEPDKVHFMVGCLSVTNLGKIVPVISDDFEALIPSGFLCSRLFWSTTEPWKLVCYNISTSTLNSDVGNTHVDKNFTVDHSFPKPTVEKQLKEILTWQRDVVDSEFEEEPQNTADLLSPELTDAIFEELPHDFLDGISVQDMFMNYEELLNLDFKSEINDNMGLSNEQVKKVDDDSEGDLKCYRELKRSKSEVFNNLGTVSKSRSHQRSCSLTWSCKLDNSLTPVMKKRKITSRDNNMYLQLLQVDGACDSSDSSDSEGPDMSTDTAEEPVSCDRCQCTYRTRASYKRHLETCDALSTSESDCDEEKTEDVSEEPNVVTSYETYSSYRSSQNEVHATILNTQTIVSSEGSEVIAVPENNTNIYQSPYQQTAPIIPQSRAPLNYTQISTNPTFCINQQPICLNQPNALVTLDNSSLAIPITINQSINQAVEIQQPIPFTSDGTQILNVLATPNITINELPQNQWLKPAAVKPTVHKTIRPRGRPRSLLAKRSRVVMSQPNSIILQHLPSTNMMPTFVDAFQQQGQNVQYVATIAPPQTQLVQLQPNSNILNLMQPTMIIQQPRVITEQLIVDGNGSMMWATQPVQPVYYGFETIVQNTVMQSQQFLPSTVPGVLTTNSSYSATTQVFQTSKLEPVLDVPTGSFVLLNSGQLVNPQQTIQMPSPQLPVTTQISNKTNWAPVESTTVVPPVPPTPTVSNNVHSINLPLAPFVSEQGIPTNIVTPTPKPPPSTQTRPMSRVLPMQTREQKKPTDEKIQVEKEIVTPTSGKITILENITLKPADEEITCVKDEPDEQIKQEWKVEKIIPPVQSKPEIIEEKTEPQPEKIAAPSNKNISSILYTIETRDGFRHSSTSIYELWSKVFEAVQSARAAHDMAPLPADALDTINNLQLLGLKTNGLRYLLEQLPGATKCTKYKPSYHTRTGQDDSDDDVDLNNSSCGAVRSLPYVRKKEPTDMFGWLASKHRKPENSLIESDLLPRRGGSVTNLPMAMRFRQLKLTSKFSVGVYRSGIHRRGLFSLRDIESGEMVIEYAGEVIRSVLTDKREKYYNSKGIGCYMFRIDDNLVVDATMKGNAARFINHSCDPNCYSKVVEIHGHKHIIIFALRRILCGEELTYDYKFPFEEDKIPCTCGARRCRKFLN